MAMKLNNRNSHSNNNNNNNNRTTDNNNNIERITTKPRIKHLIAEKPFFTFSKGLKGQMITIKPIKIN